MAHISFSRAYIKLFVRLVPTLNPVRLVPGKSHSRLRVLGLVSGVKEEICFIKDHKLRMPRGLW